MFFLNVTFTSRHFLRQVRLQLDNELQTWIVMIACECRPVARRSDSGSQSPTTPTPNAPLALTPVHTRPHPEEGSGSVQPPSAQLQTAKSITRRGPPAKSATFPSAYHSVVKAAESAVQHTKSQHVSDEHPSPGISFWGGQQGAVLESAEESMQPGTPTSGCTSDAVWEQQGNSSWSLRLSHCKPLRIARQDSGSEASTSRTTADVSTPTSPKASPKIMVVCRICEEQASLPQQWLLHLELTSFWL